MASLSKVRVQLLDESSGAVLQEVDVLTSADAVTFSDGQTFQQKLDLGILKGAKGDTGAQGIQGVQGEAFSIAKTYASVALMNAGYATDGVGVGKFVLIDTGNINDTDNAKLYVKGATSYSYITDLSGATGVQGPQGVQGIQGATGAKGDKGDIGATGAKGDAGVSMVLKNAWVTATAYVNNTTQIDIVTYNGSSYACKTSHTSSASILPTNTTYWICIAQKGDTGATGSQGIQGATGATGATGAQGIQGVKGDTGATGATGETVRVGTTYATATQANLFLKLM